MKFLIPQGIGDTIWALTKVQAIAQRSPIDLCVASIGHDAREYRAIEFLKRFSFVNSVSIVKESIMEEGPPVSNGLFRYIPTGPHPRFNFALMPNTPMEHGVRLEDWLPEFTTNFDIMKSFKFLDSEISFGNKYKEREYCVFFLGSETGNTTDGHNRNGIWTPYDWIAIGEHFIKKGVIPIVVGAEYDYSYWEKYIKPLIVASDWENQIGALSIGSTLQIVKQAKFCISYQSGVGIAASYFGVPTAIFWRAKGDSISSSFYASFEESMASAWVPPHMLKTKHLPLIYGKHGIDQVKEQIDSKGWV